MLKQIAELIRGRIRETDVLARMGGDEFALLLRGCPPEKARQVCQGICEAVGGFRFSWEGKSHSVGVSIGMVEMDLRPTPGHADERR